MLDLLKHAGEFRKYLRNHQYEKSEAGIVFPKAGVAVVGEYRHSVNGADERVDHNLVPTEGLNYLLNAGVHGGTPVTTWYMALYSGSYTPVNGLTAASFPSAASEITSGSEGYSESVRQTWIESAPASGQSDNYASRASFTIVTASTLSVNGAAVLSDSTKGSTSGTILSAAKFTSTRTLNNGDTFQLGYRVTLVGV